MITRDIEKAIYENIWPNSILVCPNVYMGRYEMDICQITKAGYVVEYEIKLSRSDFAADFKKGGGYGLNPSIFSKHNVLANNEVKRKRPSRFFFVTPRGLLKEEDIPSYAGWGECYPGDNNHHVILWKKKAPRLKGAKAIEIKDYQKLLRGMMYRYWRKH